MALPRLLEFLSAPHSDWESMKTLVVPCAVQFLFSWLAFFIFMKMDYDHYRRGSLETHKLPTRHPLVPFWLVQLRMIPLVLYNQLVVWPLVYLFLLWPIWAHTHVSEVEWSKRFGWWTIFPAWLVLAVISDQMWYWSHRFMHVPFAWKHWHRMHHVAEQCALSATYVHAVEYALFTLALGLPFALAGFPVYFHALSLVWGMFTGSGAHSGYAGGWANGEQHNRHHTHHVSNFSLFLLGDWMWGTLWKPGDVEPRQWIEAEKIWKEYPTLHGSEAAPVMGNANPVLKPNTSKSD